MSIREGGWRGKCHRIIHTECKRSYEQANRLKSGKLRKRHRPYSVPEIAQDMIHFLDTNDERGAKAMFIALSYRGIV